MSFAYMTLWAKDQAILQKPVFQKRLTIGFQAGVQIHSSRHHFLIYTVCSTPARWYLVGF